MPQVALTFAVSEKIRNANVRFWLLLAADRKAPNSILLEPNQITSPKEKNTMNLKTLHGQVIDYLKEGKFVEGIKDFYADDATAQENNKAPSRGRENMAAGEQEFLNKVTNYHGIDELASAIDDQGNGNGTVFYEAVMKWGQTDKGHVEVEQSVVERWKEGKIKSIRFYGNFDQS